MKADCGLCKRYGRGCQFHPDKKITKKPTRPEQAKIVLPRTEAEELAEARNLSVDQIFALEALATRGPDESLEDVADRAGLARVTIWRYLQNDSFKLALRHRVEEMMAGHRMRVAKSLVDGAVDPGPGQAAMQRIYWQKLGELADAIELSGPDGDPLGQIDVEKLSDRDLAQLEAMMRKAATEDGS